MVADEAVSARAIPKSITLTSPVAVNMTLPGLMSRCTMPAACACSSAVHTAAVISSARCGSSRPSALSTCRRVWPSTYSMTMYGVATPSITPSPVS